MMINKTIVLIALGFCFACGDSNSNKTGTDIVNNPVTANDSVVKSSDIAPIMTFTENIHDFGILQDGEVVTYKFKFTNTGNADLIVSSATASCGCTVPSYPKEPVKPGQESAIDVQFNSSGKSGKNEKQITILSNTVPNQTYLIIKADVQSKK